MPALFTRTPQHQLERALAKEASPIPLPRRWPAWLLVGAAGLAVGMAVGSTHRWAISPITPEPERACSELSRHLAHLPPSALEPVMTQQQIAALARHLGPQRPRHPAPPSPPPASQIEPAC